MTTDLRIALAVTHSPLGETDQNIENMNQWIQKAKNEGAELICFPEMNITGYSTRNDMMDHAESIPGPIEGALRRLACSEDITILAGMAEKDKKNRLFASHLVAEPNGIQGVYRKLHISPPERKLFTPGNQIPLFKIRNISFGIQLCYDSHFPELSTHMAVNGADMILIPHASPRGTSNQKLSSWTRHLPARAFDNGLFILACNQTGDNNNGLSFPGLALVFGPSGDMIKNDTSGNEGILIVEISAKDLQNVRNHKMRYFLPNRRPELYKS